MATSVKVSKEDGGDCMAHNLYWRSVTQWLMNQLRGSVIPVKYVSRFTHLVCNCPTSKQGPWETISNDQLLQAVTSLDYHIDSSDGNPHSEIIKKMLEKLRKAKFLEDRTPSGSNPIVPRPSALRLLYLLQQCIDHSFTIFASPQKAARQAKASQKKDHSIEIELEGIESVYIARIIGFRGNNMQMFLHRHTCAVTISNRVEGGVDRVYAKIVKRCDNPAVLDTIIDPLKQWVKEQQENVKQEMDTDSDDSDAIPDSQASQQLSAAMGASQPQSSNTTPTICLVHDRRWVSTYQYTLTQMHRHMGLPRKDGFRFTSLVCTCIEPNPSSLDYFPSNSYPHFFRQTMAAIKRWPRECQPIMSPVLKQLEKSDTAETFKSLMKFVFYFDAVENKLYTRLLPGYTLPGAPSVPRSAPAVTASSSSRSSIFSVSSNIPQSLQSPRASAGATGAHRGIRPTVPIKAPPTITSLKKVTREEWSEDCFFHGKKKRFLFQCIVNYLHKNSRLPTNLNVPFSIAVCSCKETIDKTKFYKEDGDLEKDCKEMKNKLGRVAGDSRASFQPAITLLDNYINNKSIEPGFMKVVYHFNQAFKGRFTEYEEIHDLVKQSRWNR